MINSDITEVFKKGGVALAIRMLGFLAGYLFIYFTVRYYGAETQGRLALSFSMMIIGALLCRLGVDINFVKVFAIEGNLENAKGLYFKILPIIASIALVVSISLYFSADIINEHFFKDPQLPIFLKWTAPCPFLYTMLLINAAVFRGMRKNALYSFLFNGGRFLFALAFFFVGVLIVSKNAIIPVIAHTTAVGLLCVISFFYIYKYLYPRVKTTTYIIPRFLKESLPMLFSASMIVFLGWSDTIILGIFRNSDVVGIYNVVLKIAAVTGFTVQALDSILAPKLSAAWHKNDLKGFKLLVRYATIINVSASVIGISILIIFREMILNVFGDEFLIATVALIILCLGQLFNAFGGPVAAILLMTGRQKIFQNILLIALVINVTLNLLLIEPLGINGVAIGTATSLAFWNVASVIYVKLKVY